MKRKKFDDKMNRIIKSITDNSIKCKICGHTVLLNKKDKVICDWCGYYVYIDDKTEFKDRLISEIKKLK